MWLVFLFVIATSPCITRLYPLDSIQHKAQVQRLPVLVFDAEEPVTGPIRNLQKVKVSDVQRGVECRKTMFLHVGVTIFHCVVSTCLFMPLAHVLY